MALDLIELNHAGRRLPRKVWRAAVPNRGELSVLKYMSWYDHKGGPVFAALRPYGLVEDLSKARIWHMSGRSMVLSGQQLVQGFHTRGQPYSPRDSACTARTCTSSASSLR